MPTVSVSISKLESGKKQSLEGGLMTGALANDLASHLLQRSGGQVLG